MVKQTVYNFGYKGKPSKLSPFRFFFTTMSGQGYKITAFATTDKPGKFKQITYDAPPLKKDEVYIKMLACGMCHTDVLFMDQPNLILGHEPVGEIVEVGSGASKFKKGDIVG